MNINPLVSIIIPVYNREVYINDAVQSAINQTYENLEIIIVDNHSTDNTWSNLEKISKKDFRIKIYQNKENIGPVRNWKECIKFSNGKYIKILWSDDTIEPEYISKTVKNFHEEAAFVVTEVEFFKGINKKKTIFNKKYKVKNSEYIEDIIIFNKMGFLVSPGCAIFRKNDLEESLLIDIPNNEGLYFNNYGAGNDLLIFLLIARKYKYIICLNEHLAKFRVHSDSITNSNQKKLNIYYDWAQWYFIKNYYKKNEIVKKFKSKIILHSYLYNYKKNLLDDISAKPDTIYFFKILSKRIFSKVFF